MTPQEQALIDAHLFEQKQAEVVAKKQAELDVEKAKLSDLTITRRERIKELVVAAKVAEAEAAQPE